MDEVIWVQTATEEGRLRAECPECQVQLVRSETEGVQIEACPTCGGIWFDGGELKALAQKRPGVLASVEHRHDPDSHADPAAPRLGGRLCPACQVPMREFQFPWAPGVLLNGCDRCHGIWADDGELSRVEASLTRYRREHPVQPAGAKASAAPSTARVQAFHTLISRPEGHT